MGRHLTTTFLGLFLLAFATPADARNGRQNQVPNGSSIGCDVCHTSAGGLNDFGFDSYTYTSGGSVSWNADFANADSDRDGYSNGEELGDPNGSWRTGQANPGGPFSLPGERSDGLCGNGTYEGEEECEGADLGGATCTGLGLGSGNLTCSNCKYDTAGCSTCGDGQIQPGEDCDGANLGGGTCEILGMGSGTLACQGCRFDSSGCDQGGGPETPVTCGDGIVQAGEQCDVADLSGQTCATLGFTGGTLSCAVRCTFDTANCVGAGPTTPGAGNPEPGPPETSPDLDPFQNGAGSGDLQNNKIELEGRACSTGLGATPSALLTLFGFTGLAISRRRRQKA